MKVSVLNYAVDCALASQVSRKRETQNADREEPCVSSAAEQPTEPPALNIEVEWLPVEAYLSL